MKKYYLHDGAKQHGPYSIEDLKLQNLTAETPIWFEPLSAWTIVGKVDELKSILVQAPPPFKSVSVDIPQPEMENPYLEEDSSNKKKKIFWFSGVGIILIISIVLFIQYQSKKEESEFLATQLTTAQQEIQTNTEEEIRKEKERQDRIAAATARNMEYRNNWHKYIRINENYSYYKIGGIEGVTIKAVNHTEFPIDLIIVEVTYWKDNGGVFKREEVSISDLKAKGYSVVGAPSSTRGTRVTADIKKITSRKFNFCFDKDLLPGWDGTYGDNRNPKDPWKCDQ